MWGRFAREGNPESAVFFFTCSGARPLREAGASDAASKSRLPPPFLASLRAFVRAGALRAYVRVSRAPLACVRTVRACPRMSPPLSHARTRVCTYVHCMRAHSREGEKAPSQYVRTYARTCAYVRACPRRSLLHAVCARTYARTQFLWAPAPPPPPPREGGRRLMIPTPTFSYPVRPRAHTLTGDQPGDAVPHATPCGLFVRTYARAYTFARALRLRTRARPVQGEMSPSRYAHPCTCVSTSARTSPSTPRYTRARAYVRKAFGLQRCPRHDRDVSDPLPGPSPRPRTGDQPRHEGPRATSAWRFAWHCVAAKVWLLQNALPLHGRSPTTVPPVREVPPRDGARWGVRGSDGAHGTLLHLRLCSRRHFHGGSRGRNDRAIHVDPGEMHWSYATWRGLVGPLGKHPCEP